MIDVIYKVMFDGSYFGEVDILFRRRRSCTTKAQSPSDCYFLSKVDFEKIVKNEYPEVYKYLKDLSKEKEKDDLLMKKKCRETFQRQYEGYNNIREIKKKIDMKVDDGHEDELYQCKIDEYYHNLKVDDLNEIFDECQEKYPLQELLDDIELSHCSSLYVGNKNDNKKFDLDEEILSKGSKKSINESYNSSEMNSIESIGMKKLHYYYSSATQSLKQKYSKSKFKVFCKNESVVNKTDDSQEFEEKLPEQKLYKKNEIYQYCLEFVNYFKKDRGDKSSLLNKLQKIGDNIYYREQILRRVSADEKKIIDILDEKFIISRKINKEVYDSKEQNLNRPNIEGRTSGDVVIDILNTLRLIKENEDFSKTLSQLLEIEICSMNLEKSSLMQTLLEITSKVSEKMGYMSDTEKKNPKASIPLYKRKQFIH